MNTQKTVNNLRLLADTIEALEIDNILSCEVYDGKMSCHVTKLTLANAECVWRKRQGNSYWLWEKSFSHNNIKFFTVVTKEDYEKEISS